MTVNDRSGAVSSGRLADLPAHEFLGTETKSSIHRWMRRRDARVIPIEMAAVSPSASAAPDVTGEGGHPEPSRAAAEARAHALEAVVERLQRKLKDLETTIHIAKRRVSRAEASYRSPASPAVASDPTGSEAKLYAQVGLVPGCPDFLLHAARRAYLRECHPDRQSDPAAKDRATAEFQFYDRVFKVIEESRSRTVTPGSGRR